MTATLPPDQLPSNERRARPRRTAASQRAAWMAARARNAARRGVLIATVGAIAVVGTLLVLILLPREVNRALRAQFEAIPQPTDTVRLLASLQRARARRDAADAALAARRAALAAAEAARHSTLTDSSGDAVAIVPRDSLTTELQGRLARARTSPVVESYRALADARLLRGDGRVRTILDSLEQVDREREVYAAVGGLDARYAALTARLGALGQRIIRVAEDALANAAAANAPPAAPPAPANPAPPAASAAASAAAVGTAPVTGGIAAATAAGSAAASSQAQTPVRDSTTGDRVADSIRFATARAAARSTFVRDSTLSADVVLAAESLRASERAIDEARRTNAVIVRRQEAVRSRSNVIVPPTAMLVAALVVGLALGYATAMIVELRRPTVGDEGEVERLAQARVITHTGALSVVRDSRTRRRADRALPPVLDPTADTWQQLHLTLTGLGDVVRVVRVVADQPMLGGTLAVNLAAAAARESRATLLVEPPTRTPVLAHLLRQTRTRGLSEVQQGRAELRETITEVPLGRDTSVDVLFAGAPLPTGGALGGGVGRFITGEHPARGAGAAPAGWDDELRRIAARYDLTLIVGESAPDSALASHDLILCGRLGVTSLTWLARVTQQTRSAGQRLRAVVLWAADVPVA